MLDDFPGFPLDLSLVALETEEVQGVDNGRERIAELVGKHCQELVLPAIEVGKLLGLSIADVPDVALHDPLAVHLIDVADELDLDSELVLGLQRQMMIADVPFPLEFLEGSLALL